MVVPGVVVLPGVLVVVVTVVVVVLVLLLELEDGVELVLLLGVELDRDVEPVAGRDDLVVGVVGREGVELEWLELPPTTA